jgi:hypothetical protein
MGSCGDADEEAAMKPNQAAAPGQVGGHACGTLGNTAIANYRENNSCKIFQNLHTSFPLWEM